MGYRNATSILPQELMSAVQQFVDGEYLYIPRKEKDRRSWGAGTGIRRILAARNEEICAKKTAGWSTADLAREFYLSNKTIQKIVRAGA